MISIQKHLEVCCIDDFPTNNINSILFRYKEMITGQTENNGTKGDEIIGPLKYLSNFWRTLEIPSSNVIRNSNDEINFPHKLLLTDKQVSRFCKAFANGSSAKIKLSETQLSKMLKLGRFLNRLLQLFHH